MLLLLFWWVWYVVLLKFKIINKEVQLVEECYYKIKSLFWQEVGKFHRKYRKVSNRYLLKLKYQVNQIDHIITLYSTANWIRNKTRKNPKPNWIFLSLIGIFRWKLIWFIVDGFHFRLAILNRTWAIIRVHGEPLFL